MTEIQHESAPPAGLSGREMEFELVRRASRGEDHAFGLLVDRHGGGLLSLATSMLGNAADGEDVVQETLAAALGGLDGFRGHSSVRTWLTRILIRRIARLHRSRRVRRTWSIEQAPAAEAGALGGRFEETDRADLRMDLSAVLAELSPEHREVVVLRELHGLGYEQMAEVLAVPRGTVESRLFRARSKLKELLKDYLP